MAANNDKNLTIKGLKKSKGASLPLPLLPSLFTCLFVKCLTSIHTTVLHVFILTWHAILPFLFSGTSIWLCCPYYYILWRHGYHSVGLYMISIKYVNNLLVSQVLIMDKVTVKVMSYSCKMADITDQGVSCKFQNRFWI